MIYDLLLDRINIFNIQGFSLISCQKCLIFDEQKIVKLDVQ
jgi:hypothetical protein